MANISLEVVFGMLVLPLRNADIDFSRQELWWITYTTKEALLTIRRVELVRKKEFAAAALNPEYKTYVVYVIFLSSTPLNVHLPQRPQISGLNAKKATTKIPNEYADFVNVFSPDLASKFSKYTRINNNAIKLVNGQQPLTITIYSLGLVELETLKAYIETNLAISFIRSSTSPTVAPILFDRESESFL